MVSVGSKRHRVLLQNPGPAVPDGEGGFTQAWADLSPAMWNARLEPANPREREQAGTVAGSRVFRVSGDFHPQVTLQTRIVFGSRLMSVVGVTNPNEKNGELVLVAVEQVK